MVRMNHRVNIASGGERTLKNLNLGGTGFRDAKVVCQDAPIIEIHDAT